MKKTSMIILLTFIQVFVAAQVFDERTEVQNMFTCLRNQNIIAATIGNNPSRITPFQFEGDYSRERVFPGLSPTAAICVTPITFQSSIYDALKKIGLSPDSALFQKQIKDFHKPQWRSQKLEFTTKIKFTKSKLLRWLKSEIGIISYPLFNQDRQIAIITYGTIKGNSDRVYILRKRDNDWIIIETIDSQKTY
jgi:hypothetical protein